MNTKQYTLTEKEFNTIMELLEGEEQNLMKHSLKPGDTEHKTATRLAALQNELLWQHERGERRPVQPKENEQ